MLAGPPLLKFLVIEGGKPYFMADNSTHPHHTSSRQGNNIPNTYPTYILEVGGSSQLDAEQTCKVSYENSGAIRPVTYLFAKDIRLIPGEHNLPYFLKKKETTPTRIVVSTVEYLVFSTPEELAEFIDNIERPEQPPSYNEGDEGKIVLLDDTFHRFSCHGEDSSDSEEDEDKKDENMANQYLDWMSQGPFTLLGILHNMPRHMEKLLMKYDPDKAIKAKYHLDNLYLHM